jgi:hypothetical protein
VNFLAGRKENIILDAADEALYRLGRHVNLSSNSLQSMSTSLTKSSFVLEAEPPAESQDPFRWLEDDENLDLTLDDYHTHIRTALPTPLPSTRRPSFRRTLSLNSLALARNSSSSKKSPSSPLTSNPPTPTQSSHRRPLSIVPPRSRHASRASISTIDPTAKHYRDPEARLKLRVYLASPQKFDEAIEFGFPSLETRDSFSQIGLKSAPAELTGRQGHFLKTTADPCSRTSMSISTKTPTKGPALTKRIRRSRPRPPSLAHQGLYAMAPRSHPLVPSVHDELPAVPSRTISFIITAHLRL